ncbi:hypothetical protein O3P69_002301 [Scylla paramamosain]|uniref:Ig-like domain-containing protein n=2 Tax=Scylla paramamosain TaxID=85552 RepID=A0AAW0V5Q7_SCYPA
MSAHLLLHLAAALLLSTGVRAYSDKTVEIVELVVPESPKDGEDVTLTCSFHLVGKNHRLYTVSWWRGKDQFYTYKGTTSHDPKHAYTFRGIQVKVDESTERSVVLKNVSEETSGIFKCEVMGEGPSFRTAVETKAMNVVVTPKLVEIHTRPFLDPPVFHIGERVNLNCTATGAKPRAHLVWEINGQPVKEQVSRYPDFEDQRGRVTSTVRISWEPPAYFLKGIAHVACHALVGGHTTTATKEIYLDPASSAAFNHQYASAGCQLPTTWAILSLASFLLARPFPIGRHRP